MPIPVVYSWSTGKDSAFGLWTILRDPAYEVRALLTTLTETYDRVSISGVRETLLDGQAEMLDLPLIKVRIPPACPNDLYEQRMASTLAAEHFQGIDHVAFSDLFLEDVRTYREERLAQVRKQGVFPLWGYDTTQLARDIIAQRFRAIVVCLDPQVIDPSFAGRTFDLDFLADLPEQADPCGENGEFTPLSGTLPCTGNPSPAGLATSSPEMASSIATFFRHEARLQTPRSWRQSSTLRPAPPGPLRDPRCQPVDRCLTAFGQATFQER